MNLYELFRRASGSSILPRSKMLQIWKTHCPELPLSLLEAHRKIFHLQIQLGYWRPLDNKAMESDVGNYVDVYGTIKATTTRRRAATDWEAKSVYKLRDTPGGKTVLSHKYLTNAGFRDILDIFHDRRLNPIFIGKDTVPKWEPKSKTICMDTRDAFSKSIERMMKYSVIVLRYIPLEEENQYKIWTLHRKSYAFKEQYATITNDSIGLGKTIKGSQRSGLLKNAKQVSIQLGV